MTAKEYAMKLADQIESAFAGHPDLAGEIAEFIRRDAQALRDETCEGYSNYATFQVAAIVDNNQALSEKVDKLLADAIVEPTEWPVLRQADALKNFITDLADSAVTSRVETQLAAGLKNAGLAEVNWRELVEGWTQ